MSDVDIKTVYKCNVVDINTVLKNISVGAWGLQIAGVRRELALRERDDSERDEWDNKVLCAQSLKVAGTAEKMSKYNAGDNVDDDHMDADIAELMFEHAGDIPD